MSFFRITVHILNKIDFILRWQVLIGLFFGVPSIKLIILTHSYFISGTDSNICQSLRFKVNNEIIVTCRVYKKNKIIKGDINKF